MKNRKTAAFALPKTLVTTACAMAFFPVFSVAQVPVDENGEVLGNYEAESVLPATGNEEIPLLSTVDLEELVGPIALYPDDLLAIVLPAAAYPLQIVDAARFLEALEDDPSLAPDPDWDESVVALLNYPEVIELLNDDIDWTWRLGEAVVAQQADVIAAVETFRDRAYAAGNLKSDSYQTVSKNDGVIEITPIADDEIYVPYYEPERVVVYQPRPVYYYYPRPCPVYYYPYSSAYAFDRRYFWGVTTAFRIGWFSDSLNVFHHSYFGHPYYGRSYWDRWWYRRPSLNIHNTTYVSNNTRVTVNRYDDGDRWRPRSDRRDFAREDRITRNREYRDERFRGERTRRHIDSPSVPAERRSDARRPALTRQAQRRDAEPRERNPEPIVFRDRPQTATPNRNDTSALRRADSRDSRRDADATTRIRGDVVRRRTEDGAQRRPERESRERRIVPAHNLGRAETTSRPRRVDSSSQARRAEPRERISRSETLRASTKRTSPKFRDRSVNTSRQESVRARPAPQTRRAEPSHTVSRPEPRRHEKAQRSAAPSPQARQSSERKSANRESAKRESTNRRSPERKSRSQSRRRQ